MAEPTPFEWLCARLAERTELTLLEARGTVRLALKSSGLNAHSVQAAQLAVVLERPRFELLQALTQLERRGGLLHSTGEGFEFEHDLLREAIESDLSPARNENFGLR